MKKFSFLFLSANTPWVYALAEAMANSCPTRAVRFYDWSNYYRLHPTWPKSKSDRLHRSMCVLPPGYASSFELFSRLYLRSKIRHWCYELEKESGEYPWVVAPYPYLASWVRDIAPDKLIYYNLDDYVLYQPARRTQILANEAKLVAKADKILCLAQYQVKTLCERYPAKANQIYHYPLGVDDVLINSQPINLPQPMTVGYVGNLTERVDWELVKQVAQMCSQITFVFVGSLEDYPDGFDIPNWRQIRSETLALPNIRHIGHVPQAEVVKYYWSFALNWIPYTVSHPFNQASCPTKIMDTIATGRPVISTDVPECRLYPEWITIFYSEKDAADLIGKKLHGLIMQDHSQRSINQIEFAQQNTWQVRAQQLKNILNT